MSLKFPKNFYWGAATSAHQVEGGNHNDWSEWEKANAERLAKEAKEKWEPWQQEKFPEMFKPENYISGRSCDHYHLYKQDFDIAKSLGQNAHHFSIEWSRMEPEEGKFDEKEIEHYRQVISALQARGIEPFVTLWHWTNPLWIRDIGGWENKKTIEYFLRYAKKILESCGGLIKYWTPLNEPSTYIGLSYIKGTQPPAVKNIFCANRVFRHLMIAYRETYKLIHSFRKDALVGVSHYTTYRIPVGKYPWNNLLIKFLDYITSGRFIKRIKNSIDFLGIQYYRPEFVKLKLGGQWAWILDKPDIAPQDTLANDLGWGISPEGIHRVLTRLKKYNKPIYITECGLADARDVNRGEFIKEHLFWLAKAMKEGADVRGFFYWSLLDNFEFVEVRGFWPRFGLVEIDYKNLERKIRPSAWEYAKICKENRLGTD